MKGSSPGSLASSTKPSTTQPPPQDHPETAAFIEEEIALSHLSLEEEIDEFYFEEKNPKAPLINLSDAEGELDRNSGISTPLLVITCPNNSSVEEEDNMALKKGNKSLKELMAARGKRSTSKAPTKS